MSGRVALVTGGSSGIGAATAVRLAALGHSVAVGYATGSERAEKIVASIEEAGGRAVAVALDVADSASVDRGCARVEDELGRVEVLVANAGIAQDGLALRMGDEQWETVLNVNLTGAFRTARRVLPGMVRNRFGRIVCVSSVAGSVGSPGQTNYAAAKAGLVGLTRSLAREVASRQITCNVVEPGPITTPMTDELSDDRRSAFTAAVPLARFGTPEEVAAVVAFLASDEAGFVTGAVIPVDGGLAMGR